MSMTRVCLSSLLMLGLVASVVAQDAEKDTQTVTAKAEKVQRAKFVDFGSELGLPIASLENLGEQIDAARLASSPVDLAVTAKLLEAAEAVSGKKASLTAQSLTDEATSLAKQRGNPAELATIAKLMGGDAAAELEAVAKAAAREAGEEGEATRALEGDLIVDNHSHEELHVYVDGREIGHVRPHSYRVFHVHHAHYAEARDHYGHRWRANFNWGHYHRYRMLVEPPHYPHHYPHH